MKKLISNMYLYDDDNRRLRFIPYKDGTTYLHLTIDSNSAPNNTYEKTNSETIL